jgi:D-threo-aldose 1-dehydrogenase
MAPRRAGLTVDLPSGVSPVASSPLVFGGGPIGGLYAPVSDEAATATLEAAWAAGSGAFDTAPHYGAGLSEQPAPGTASRWPRPRSSSPCAIRP